MKRIFSAFLAASLSHQVFADPSPFGLELGVATVAEARAKYAVQEAGTNRFSLGPMFDVSPAEVSLDGLKQLKLIFDGQEVLVGVVATLQREKFSSLRRSLNSKYRQTSQHVPFVGDAEVRFSDGDSEIILESPHLSFEMTLAYLRNSFLDSKRRQQDADREAIRRSEDGQL